MDVTLLVATVTQAQVEAQLLGYMTGSQLQVTAWVRGSVAQQIVALFARALVVLYAIVQQMARSLFLDTATDPGDVDSQPEGPGWLSALGQGQFGTVRAFSTFANGEFTFNNNSGAAIEFGPEEVTFEHIDTGKTYRNTLDVSLYTGPGTTLSIANGASVTFPIQAEEVGTDSNAVAGKIQLVTVFAGVTGTNAASIIGQDKQSADRYRFLCRANVGRLSPNGMSFALEWLAGNLNTDGSVAIEDDGKTRINVNRSRVTTDNAFGIVDSYFASPSGAVDAGEFTTLDDACSRLVTPDGVTSIRHNTIATVIDIEYAASSTGGDAADIEAAILAYLDEWFPTVPISGYDFNGTSGFLTTNHVETIIAKAVQSVFDVTVTAINGGTADIVFDVQHVPVLGTVTATINIE